MYRDYFHISPGPGARGSFRRFRAPEVQFEETYDTELVKTVERLARERGFPAGTRGGGDPELDHGTMVPLWFLRQVCGPFRLLRIGLSGLPLEDHYVMGFLLKQAVEKTGRRAVYIASGDLSHKLQSYGPYGYAPEGPLYDERVMDVCARGAFGELLSFDEDFCSRAAECGHRSFVMMAGAMDGVSVHAERLSHEDVTGVGYGICTFTPGAPDPGRRFLLGRSPAPGGDEWVRLARRSLEHYVCYGFLPPVPEDLPLPLRTTRAGAFVSLHRHGQLRGCIGTISPVRDSLAEEIMENAVSAAVRDPRFDPVRPEELPDLEIHVDVLGEAEDIPDESALDVRRYGVIVSRGFRRGLLLPDLEGVDTVREQVDIARRKAGIRPEEPVSLQRFEVVRHT